MIVDRARDVKLESTYHSASVLFVCLTIGINRYTNNNAKADREHPLVFDKADRFRLACIIRVEEANIPRCECDGWQGREGGGAWSCFAYAQVGIRSLRGCVVIATTSCGRVIERYMDARAPGGDK